MMKTEDIRPLVETFRCISDELGVMHDLLQQECHALTNRIVAEIESVALKKQSSVDRILDRTELQRRFFESKQIANGEAGLERFLERFDTQNPDLVELRNYQKKIREYLEQCKKLNVCNGASIELLNRHTRRTIDVLRNAGNPAHTYGPDGNTHNIAVSRARISV